MAEKLQKKEDFNPRPPRGGRPGKTVCGAYGQKISIHALREEGDPMHRLWQTVPFNFNPRPPRGGRRFTYKTAAFVWVFQSTPSARRATRHPVDDGHFSFFISIHALREEGDNNDGERVYQRWYFNPRPPRGGRPHPAPHGQQQNGNFNPRPPRGGRLGYIGQKKE